MSSDAEPAPSVADTAPIRPPLGRPRMATASGTMFAPRWASPWWLMFLALAVAEVAALVVREQRVPSDQDWVQAAELVRGQIDTSDAVTVAPAWADPLLRLHLGDRMTLKMSGRSDLSPFERLWVLSIRGHRAPEAPQRLPDFREIVGRVTVERYDLGPSPVVLDLVDALPSASVSFRKSGLEHECPWKERVGGPARGGLGFGPVAPRQRFVCDANKPWMWVGSTVIEDLSLAPRRCVFQHPYGPEPVSVTYDDVHLGSHLVLYAGLDYHQERKGEGAPVTLRVLVGDREIGRMVHQDGEGFRRIDMPTRAATDPERGDLRIEVSSLNAHKRAFCWSATLQDAARREAP